MEQVVPPSPRRLTSVIIILVIVCGLASALFAAITVDLRSREYLQGRAQTIADTLPAESITFLEGVPEDADKFEYKQVKTLLERVKANNRDLSYVYLMENRKDAPIFLVDASLATSEDFSPPGEVYTEGSEQLRSGFSSNKPFIEGPSRDKWGAWLSAFAPVVNPANNHIIAWVGIDTPAWSYYSQILIYALVPLCLAAIPLAGLLRDRKMANKEWEISQLKQQFVSIASHELRSPLSGMVWATQSLLKSGSKNLTAKQQKLLEDMFQSAQASTATVNEILDLSVFERRQSQRQDEVVELVSIVNEVQKTMSLGAQEHRLTLTTEDFPDSAYTSGDLMALKRALINVVSNAIKYSFEDTTIFIRYKHEKDEHVVSVQDHGMGIPKNEQDKVLLGYHRAKNASKSNVRGTGLGLWTSKLIIEDHNGRMWLESEEGKGTTIHVALPDQKSKHKVKATKTS